VPQILTTNATILCPHGGKGTTVPTSQKWKISGGLVLLENDAGTLSCPFSFYPCGGYTLRSMGLNATKVDGRRVILVSDFNQSVTGLPLTMVDTHTTIDNSTPVAIPAGQAASPLPPALTDMTPPTVTAFPTALVFDTTTMMPATVSVTLTLASAHPLRWVLIVLSESGSSSDITDASSPGLTVSPKGGGWHGSPLAVTVTMTAAYMASLPHTRHHFFMTAVSQRGLAGSAEAVLLVS
jgi:hypothetical protein